MAAHSNIPEVGVNKAFAGPVDVHFLSKPSSFSLRYAPTTMKRLFMDSDDGPSDSSPPVLHACSSPLNRVIGTFASVGRMSRGARLVKRGTA